MPFAIPFPNISPEIFAISIGSFEFALRWYALAYITGLLVGWWLIVRAMKQPYLWPDDTPPMRPDQVERLLTAVVLGVILGGRLGFVLFYQPSYYLQNPLDIIRIWDGGMAFHGGLIGVTIATGLFCRIHRIALLQVADAIALVTGVGLFLGRIANFINAELWGRPTDLPWGVIFPGALAQNCPGPVGLVERAGTIVCARHPSQLYEAFLEGAVLLAIAFYVAYRRRWLQTPGALTGVFLATYGMARFFVEFARQPDPQFVGLDNPIGFAIAVSPTIGLTMGQILSTPMMLIGVVFIAYARHRRV